MRRPTLVLTVALAALIPLASEVAAIGPGGWDHLGHGATVSMASLNGTVTALNADAPGVLLVGGNFTSAGGNPNAARIATWNGSAWNALGGTPISNGIVKAIAYHNGRVFAGGTFLNAGGNADADFLAVWDGGTWGPFCNPVIPGPSFGAEVLALQVIGNTLFVGGAFQNAAGIKAADYLLACDLTTGVSTSTVDNDGDFSGAVYALTADSNGTLYVGGSFINLDKIGAADYVASYSGATWHPMGFGPAPQDGAVEGIVRALAANGTDVYVGTDFKNVAGIAQADHVVRWDGATWSAVGANAAGNNGWFSTLTFVYALTTSGPLVVAAGSFQNANGLGTADGIAYFDGKAWRPIGSDGAGNGPMIGDQVALAVFGGRVHSSGNFTKAGGDAMARFVAAYSLRQPDARIGIASLGPFTGNAVYSRTAAGESRTRTISRGNTGTFWVSAENDGLVPASFMIKGTGGARGITVRYYRGTTNVTAAVKAGTYATGLIAPRASIKLKMVVSVAGSSARSTSFLVKLMSTAGTPVDAVRAIVNAR